MDFPGKVELTSAVASPTFMSWVASAPPPTSSAGVRWHSGTYFAPCFLADGLFPLLVSIVFVLS